MFSGQDTNEMKKIPAIFLALAALLFSSCAVNPGEDFIASGKTGKVIVVTDVTGAAIFADDKATGKVTPDTLILTPGTHTIRVEKELYVTEQKTVTVTMGETTLAGFTLALAGTVNKFVLVEDFSNVSCVPCVATNKILRNFHTNSLYSPRTILLKFPAAYPSPYDPLYLHIQQVADARLSFYNVLSTPTVWVDGVSRPTPGDSIKIRDAIAARLQKASPFNIDLKDSLTATEVKVTVKVTYLDSAGVDFSQLVLYTAVAEDSIVYAQPPGSNGETVFYDVLRSMQPSASGESLPVYAKGVTRTFNYSIPISSQWIPANLSVISYIQSRKTKEVYQAVKK